MAQEGKISFIGLANWNDQLFSEMCWPDPFDGDDPVLDREAFGYELLMQTAELEVCYPDPEFMQHAIGRWSATRLPVWNHLWATTQYEYNPIENYDRTEEGTDTDTHSGTDENENTLTRSGADTVTDTPDTTHYEAAYDSAPVGDSDGLTPVSREGGEYVSEKAFDSSDTNEGSYTYGHEITREHELHVHGNIGTVTAQKMIQEEREIAKFNFYDIMIQDFKDRFCILVY